MEYPWIYPRYRQTGTRRPCLVKKKKKKRSSQKKKEHVDLMASIVGTGISDLISCHEPSSK